MAKLVNGYKSKEEVHYFSDVIKENELPLFHSVGDIEPGQLKMLSLFSGCGGMDLGFEGDFICNIKSVPSDLGWIERKVNKNWVLLKKNRFATIFANDILEEAYLTWTNYMERYGKDPSIYHLDSIVDLVKLHLSGEKVFPEGVDIVTGGFPCQDFSIAGKRLGFNSITSHDGSRLPDEVASEENRGKLYFWMKQVIEIAKPKIFVAENVKGLTNLGNVKDIIQKDFSKADGDGYIVLHPRVLHAGDYGVPETRERVIFIGIRRSALNEKPGIFSRAILSRKNITLILNRLTNTLLAQKDYWLLFLAGTFLKGSLNQKRVAICRSGFIRKPSLWENIARGRQKSIWMVLDRQSARNITGILNSAVCLLSMVEKHP